VPLAGAPRRYCPRFCAREGLERYADAFGGMQQDVAFCSLQPGAQ
jgi:hypothetical protein